MIKPQLLLVVVSIVCTIKPSDSPHAGVKPAHYYDIPSMMNALPHGIARNIFSFVAAPHVKMRFNPQPAIEQAMRQDLGDDGYNELRQSFGDGQVMTPEQARSFKLNCSMTCLLQGTRDAKEQIKSLITTEEFVNPVGPMALNRMQAEAEEAQARQLRKERRAQSSTWQRFSGMLGGVCGRCV